MKFGKHLEENKVSEWRDQYIDYNRLKEILKALKNQMMDVPSGWEAVSLSTAPPTNAAAMPGEQSPVTHNDFFEQLDTDMDKVRAFTKTQVDEIRRGLRNADTAISSSEKVPIGIQEQVDAIGQHFLQLEKYVNLNFTGFRKILKKHDKNMTTYPATPLYLARLHQQSWVRSDCSDIILEISKIWSKLRGDAHLEAQGGATQDFLRKTTKYWIRPEFVTAVKYIVSRRLPVYLFREPEVATSDAQLVNSVYLDNTQLELYHGRLDKTPGAIALRLRWYGTGEPEVVFVERKTHRDSWTGDVSVKERFIITAKEVPLLLAGYFPIDEKLAEMRAKGTYSEQEIEDWQALVTEVCTAINSKQLIPTMRTQYMRTAFQIANDATVRVSLDTNLTMIYERDAGVEEGVRWYRDPKTKVPESEITRFPHAVLEVKLEVAEGNEAPQWVEDLIRSDMVCEVHKFSKFVHGCAVLMQDDVQAVPYWIDDPTIAQSIHASKGGAVLDSNAARADSNRIYPQLMPHGAKATERRRPARRLVDSGSASASTIPDMQTTIGATSLGVSAQEIYGVEECYDECWNANFPSVQAVSQKVEPKLHFANERTFIHWLHMAVHMSALASAVLAFAPQNSLGEVYAMMMLPLAVSFVIYALFVFHVRDNKLSSRQGVRWDDPYGPVIGGSVLILALSVYFGLQLAELAA